MLHGDERRKRYGHGSGGHDGGTNLLRQYGPLDHRGTSADKLRPGPQQLHVANDAAYGRDGPLSLSHQRFYQARLEGGFFLRIGCGGWPHSRDAAYDRIGLPIQRSTRDEPQEGDRQTAQFNSEFRWHGRAVHRQDGYAD